MTKYLAHLPRLFLGLVFTVFGIAGLFHLMPQPPLPEGIAGTYISALGGTYLFTLVKLTEVVAGVLFLANRFSALAAILIAPVVVNIFAAHAFVLPGGLGLPIALVAALVFVAWQRREAYRPLFVAKTQTAAAASEPSARTLAAA
ncbi:MAG: DoxX family protein [Archangium sp.]